MNRSDFLIGYTYTACNQRWLMDTEHRLGLSVEALYGPDDATLKAPAASIWSFGPQRPIAFALSDLSSGLAFQPLTFSDHGVGDRAVEIG
jgi:hypothetical protein